MEFIELLDQKLQTKFLLNHPFYKAWVEGRLTTSCLQIYAQQYFHNVDAFPRYLSATHMNCDDLHDRQALLENLIEEERGKENHPVLWLQFAEGLNLTSESVKAANLFPETKELIKTFMNQAKFCYSAGLGALYAYERQIPDVARSKIAGLKTHYNITEESTIKFFEVHQQADVWHADVMRELLTKLNNKQDQEIASTAAMQVADALWNFLSGIQRETIDKFITH